MIKKVFRKYRHKKINTDHTLIANSLDRVQSSLVRRQEAQAESFRKAREHLESLIASDVKNENWKGADPHNDYKHNGA